jgi:hypothetical protein
MFSLLQTGVGMGLGILLDLIVFDLSLSSSHIAGQHGLTGMTPNTRAKADWQSSLRVGF